MARTNPLLSTFSGGEINPLLIGRVDLSWYSNACQRLRNMIVLTEGAATRRPPSRFVAAVADSGKATIVRRFEFSTTQAYVLEFGEQYVRFYANKAVVTNIQAIAGAADNGGGAIRLTVGSTVGLDNGQPAVVAGVAGTIEANGNWGINVIDATHVDLNGSAFAHAYAGGGTMAGPVQTATPFLQAELAALKFVQSADVLFIYHPNHPPQQLERLSNTNWQVVPLPFTDGPYLEVNPDNAQTLSAAATSGATTIGAAGVNPFAPTDVGRFVRLGHIAPDWVASTVYGVGAVVKNGANGVYRCSIAGTSAGAGGPTGVGAAIGDGTCAWDFVNAGGIQWGYATITGYNSPSSVNVTVNLPFASTDATYFWRLGLYSDTTGWPACGLLHQQRMLMAGAAVEPDRIDASKIADFGNFTPGVADDDPLAETLGLPDVNAIFWMASKRAALIGTQGTVEKAFGSSGYDSAITPTSFEMTEQVSRGALNAAPVRVINALIYIQRLGRKLLDLVYDFTQDLDQATEITARARHLTEGGVTEIAYSQEPYSIIWGVRADGALLGCTYYREQQFVAWHLHQLGGVGIVESIATIPSGATDQLWMVVRRTINGQTKRYIEVLDDFNAVEDTVGQADLFFADSYAVYQGAPATHIAGLDYLEGMTVVALADGAAVTGLTVTAGAIDLPVAASKVYVGLDYADTTELMPMPIETGSQGGTPVAQMKRIDKLAVGLYRTGEGFRAGADADHCDAQYTRAVTDPMDASTPLFTGPYELPFNGDYALQADVLLKPNGPLPLTVLWLVPRMATNEG